MAETESSQTTPIGWKARDFRLIATDDREYALRAFADKIGLAVIFTCNHCPYAKATWPQLVELSKKYDEHVGFVAINPNDEKAYPDDSFEKMKQYAEKWDVPFPYLRDETQEVAKAYDAQCTPDIYLFTVKDVTFSLFYRGRISDNWKQPKKAKDKSFENAMKALIAGDPPPEEQIPSVGCSIKWK